MFILLIYNGKQQSTSFGLWGKKFVFEWRRE